MRVSALPADWLRLLHHPHRPCAACVGVCKENRCLLGVYVILLFLVLFINLAAAIMAVGVQGTSAARWAGLDKQQNFSQHPWYQQQARTRPSSLTPAAAPVYSTVRLRKKNACDQERAGGPRGAASSTNIVYMRAALITVILAILLQILCIICSVIICRQIASGNESRVV
uniref:Uncharacterized protein n=1 Tax=Macrostomum lignano TaxID=282301 RepID=A0A1I8FJD5_9PLAT